ncbi:TonB-dependent receptor [Pedobacter insulae]|uniref:TonB-dependent Receptor Plug Domain n=1 Tax=Pedobacter insulae TaxID=414048 RepID=A0A1I2XH02_9SPHI|nr:carboxypeptidase-like regulatory domain-containing protein [Pedobacter insulae]SFH11966.1 TonB-dependent Receptor Plug Domain [Pedobacter insulae]
MRFSCFYICCLLFLTLKLAAQQTDGLYSVDYRQTKVSSVVAGLEAKSGLHFYYDKLSVDSVLITAKVDRKPLNVVLTTIFQNTEINFVIHEKNIFLTRNKSIKAEIAEGYYADRIKRPPTQNELAKTMDSDLDDQTEKTLNAVTPNKIYEIGIKSNILKKGIGIVAGYVKDLRSEEPIEGAVISTADFKIKAVSNEQGLYSISLPYGPHLLNVKASGNRDSKRQVVVYGDGKLNIELREKVVSLKEVKIVSNKASNVKSLEMGVNRLDMKTIKKIPAVFGEPDILRVVLTLPGVQSVGEASTGFNVRGGSADQNLILLNDATVYNPSHFFGFFSAFNPDIVKDVQLYKSTIPEKFGGRLASVLEVTNREGDKSKITGSAGIGLLTSRFNIEGPIDSGKTSFIFGGRTTYSNWMLKLLPAEYEKSKADFHDFNLGLNHQINEKHTISLSAYYSKDNFKLNSDTNYNYNNRNVSLKWKHSINQKLNGALTLASDFYEYNIKSDVNQVNAYKLNFNINQSTLKYDMVYALNSKHTLNFGISSIHYKLSPGNFTPLGNESLVVPDIVPTEQALESAIFIGDQFDVSNDFSINAGLRYSFYNYLGPQVIRNYPSNLPITEDNLLGTTTYGKNKFINSYGGPEIRVSARYNFKPDLSVKAAYNTLRQYIHLLSNTTAIAPTDVWKLSDPNIKPQFGDQVSLGLYKNFETQGYETSVEVYYKKLKDFLDYRSGANLVLNQHIETDLISTKGKAYGIEFLIKRNYGKLNGWMSYAYSRTQLKMDDITIGPLVNRGEYYPANYDKPHAFNFTGNYRFKHRYNLSLNLTYSTGRPITLPIAKFNYGGSERVYYADRNANRIPDYFRSDVSFNIEGNHKVHQRLHNSYTIGFYNLTGRKNPYSVYYVQEGGVISGYKLSIFASVIPFINYNIKF